MGNFRLVSILYQVLNKVVVYSTLHAAHTVLQGRLETERILHGDDDRLLVVVGCVIIIKTMGGKKGFIN